MSDDDVAYRVATTAHLTLPPDVVFTSTDREPVEEAY